MYRTRPQVLQMGGNVCSVTNLVQSLLHKQINKTLGLPYLHTVASMLKGSCLISQTAASQSATTLTYTSPGSIHNPLPCTSTSGLFTARGCTLSVGNLARFSAIQTQKEQGPGQVSSRANVGAHGGLPGSLNCVPFLGGEGSLQSNVGVHALNQDVHVLNLGAHALNQGVHVHNFGVHILSECYIYLCTIATFTWVQAEIRS